MRVLGKHDSFHDPTLFTPWSLTHLAFGLAAVPITASIFGPGNDNFWIWFVAHGLWELKDAALSYFPEACRWVSACDKSFVNSLCDQVMAILGFLIARSLNITSVWTGLAIITGTLLIMLSPPFSGKKDR